ncbi:hypothetical protein J7M22_11200 [Candidatus Poribacteria bacterium]|nr:hypothetical protein [Candidatus Poribacteria bacterium]
MIAHILFTGMLTFGGFDLSSYEGGAKDATEAIQGMLDKAGEKGGGEVFLPAGRYRIEGSLRVPPGVTLTGTWRSPHHSEGLRGTVLLAYGGRGDQSGPALIELSPSSAVRGLTILYPEQTVPEVIPYPPAIRGSGMHSSVMDVTLVNSYIGIDFNRPHELHYIRNVFGCPLRIGVIIDGCTDIGRVENVHFNPHYWARSGAQNVPDWKALLRYIWENCEAFVIGRSDWEYHLNTFSYGCHIGYHFVKSEHGACNGNFLGIAADWAWRALLVEQTQRPGLLITNGEWVGGEGSDAMIEVAEGNEGVIQLSNCSFWGPAERIALIAGRGVVTFSQCNFCQWDHSKRGYPAIEAVGGSLIVQGSTFWLDKAHLLLSGDLKSAIVNGNLFRGEPRIENRGDADLQVGLNSSMK